MTAVSSTSSTSNSTSSTSLSKSTSAADQQNQFLTLLVAQLNNQDPTNPMDNSQMTTQIAQINTVSGIQQLNTTMNNMASQLSSMQVMQGTSLIGRNVLTAGSNVAISNKVGTGAFDLASDADKVTVQILSPGGQVVDTLSLGAMTAGQQAFQWDASNYTTTGTPTFKVTATAAGQAVTATNLEVDTVGAVSSDSSGMNVILTNGTTVAYSAIKSIL